MAIEFFNSHDHSVHLTGPDGQQITVGAKTKVSLPAFFERYVSKGFLERYKGQTPSRRIQRIVPAVRPNIQVNKPHLPKVVAQHRHVNKAIRKQPRQVLRQPQPPSGKTVGKKVNVDPQSIVGTVSYPVSNNIGVGILSFNRLGSLVQLVDKIRAHTDLKRTTVFISDDGSTNPELLAYLDVLKATEQFVVLHRQKRLGVAGNTNRLMRCLQRFKHCLLLNDDVEVLKNGWEYHYPSNSEITGLKHFCMRQPGVYGASPGIKTDYRGIEISVIRDKPQGAVLYYDQAMVNAIGYFDEQAFGLYGMEHVDWSRRAAANQGIDFYCDTIGSGDFFTVHNAESAVPDRPKLFSESKSILAGLDRNRGFVQPLSQSEVPAVSYVIPCRGADRLQAIGVVVRNLLAQRFPVVEVNVVEHDVVSRLTSIDNARLALFTEAGNGLFNKSAVFNFGVCKQATHDKVILHDADMLVDSLYTDAVASVLDKHEACHIGKAVVYTTKNGLNTITTGFSVPPKVECDHVVDYFEGGSLGCLKSAYKAVGGFDERFVGYGVEDCEFYQRLAASVRWLEARTRVLIHLWHQRTEGWSEHHQANKQLGEGIQARPIAGRIADLRSVLAKRGYL